MDVRTFIALELSEAAKAGILACIDELRRAGLRASWSRESTMHLTLRFLGDVPEEKIPAVAEAAEAAATGIEPFDMTTTALGAFPSPARPRVIWAGIDAPDALYELQESLESELSRIGFRRERRRFHPHVTLGRLRARPEPLDALLPRVEVPGERSRVGALRIMKSTLAPGGAVHEIVREVPLGTRQDSP
ncbi:MAG: RNA 2',3'-cyclic phosphodiesterase [Candidatus Eisenbacteria bacterium]|nr:RNA 2',3'-cyclic phosphodiesterase [Candidatus Eisenbacteria bacterium]